MNHYYMFHGTRGLALKVEALIVAIAQIGACRRKEALERIHRHRLIGSDIRPDVCARSYRIR